jgi:hypothetical protein
MNLIPENLNEIQFERGGDPFQTLSIGLLDKIRKEMTGDDLYFYLIYRDGGYQDFEDSAFDTDDPDQFKEDLAKVKYWHSILKDYDLQWGDTFPDGLEKEAEEYANEAARGRHAYDISIDPTLVVAFSEIEFPKLADREYKLKKKKNK